MQIVWRFFLCKQLTHHVKWQKMGENGFYFQVIQTCRMNSWEYRTLMLLVSQFKQFCGFSMHKRTNVELSSLNLINRFTHSNKNSKIECLWMKKWLKFETMRQKSSKKISADQSEQLRNVTETFELNTQCAHLVFTRRISIFFTNKLHCVLFNFHVPGIASIIPAP